MACAVDFRKMSKTFIETQLFNAGFSFHPSQKFYHLIFIKTNQYRNIYADVYELIILAIYEEEKRNQMQMLTTVCYLIVMIVNKNKYVPIRY